MHGITTGGAHRRGNVPGAGTSAPGRLLLASATAASAAINVALVPGQLADHRRSGWSFAVAGRVQMGIALSMARPVRCAWVAAAALVNLVLLGAWAMSRTAGLPWSVAGEGALEARFLDMTSAALEAAAVLLALGLLVKPRVGEQMTRAGVVGVSVVPLVVVAITTAALTSPIEAVVVPTPGVEAAGGAGAPAKPAVPSKPAEAPAAPGTDMHADGHQAEHADGNADEHAHDAAQVYQPLDAASQRLLTAQMERARTATMQYPTVKDVVAAGASRVSVFTPGSGAHYMFPIGFGGVNRMTFDPDNPLMLLYAGNDHTSPVVGVMYLTFGDGAPEGFAGPNDQWHMHKGACLGYGSGAVDVLLPIDKDATREACDEVAGRFMDITPWMIHVWTAPGWESPKGVFSHDNDLLVCTDGSTTAKDDFVNGCKGLA